MISNVIDSSLMRRRDGAAVLVLHVYGPVAEDMADAGEGAFNVLTERLVWAMRDVLEGTP